jgi:hypothetical protein
VFCSHHRQVATRQSDVEKYLCSSVALTTASSFSLVTTVNFELSSVYEKLIKFELIIPILVIDNIVTYLVTIKAFGLIIAFIVVLKLVTTSNYSTVANLHTLLLITAHAVTSLAVAW